MEVFGTGAFAKLLHERSVPAATSVAQARRQLAFELETDDTALAFAPDERMDHGALDVVLVAA